MIESPAVEMAEVPEGPVRKQFMRHYQGIETARQPCRILKE
jgi:hypothetical protein